MVSNETILVLKNVTVQLPTARLTAEEEEKLKYLAEELRVIFDKVRLRSY